MIFLDILILVVCVLALWAGAEWFVEASARIARRLGLSEVVIGLTIVAVGTSAPEFAVTILAAFEGNPEISVGNIVGSNVFNLGFVLGGVAMLRAVVTTPWLVRRDGVLLIGATVLGIVFLRDLALVRWEGIVMLVALVSYILFLLRTGEASADEVPPGSFHWFEVPRLFIGLAVILISSYFFVTSSVSIARTLGISEWAIGVTIVAAGTSVPELVTSFVAMLRGRHGISAGNLIGSNVFNTLGVLGLASAIQPLVIQAAAYRDLIGMLFFTILVVAMMRTGWRVSRTEGAILVGLNLVLWYVNLFL